jgi:hypothetical protein
MNIIGFTPKFLLIALIITAASAFWAGWEWRDRAADAELLAEQAKLTTLRLELAQAATTASEQARELERLTAAQVALANEAEALRSQEREVVERVVTNEVIRYVQSPNAGLLTLPAEWVRIHDRAAAGRSVPETAFPSRNAYADAGRVTDADALAVTTDNYATCHAIRDQLIALQDWVKAISK